MADYTHADKKRSLSNDFEAQDSDSDSATYAINALIAEDNGHDIKLRTMSWQRAAWLLAGDQICLAIMAQSWSLSVLGWVPGIITMVVAGVLFYITSMTMHRFIMRHPQIKDICDFGYYAFGKSRIAYEFTAIMLLLNNIMLIGFHVLTGAKVLNTLSDHSLCTVIFSVIVTLMGIVMSLPRTLNHVSFMSMFSAACMAIAILLFLIFAGTEDHPLYGYNGVYPAAGPVKTYAFPLEGTTWVAAMNAVLNITFLWVPQILFPTFISEMEKPQDFPKALAVLTGISAFLFIVPPAIGFRYLGQYATAPAFGSLASTVHKKASFAFVIVPTVIIGVIYANVSAKFVYGRIMGKSRHAHSNTVLGWGVWIIVMTFIWFIGFIFAEVIPSMGDFLSLLGAAFDSFFGFIFFAVAYWQLHKTHLFSGLFRSVKTVTHIFVMMCGLFLLGPGLYAAVKAIMDDYSGGVNPAFSCANVAI
ncbi:putative amino acid transporter [Dothidotthia symphoricarpi CBS 119687]|uniref:Putative amino acid transporter n=1 Tax=Dothidotthia symphoricarpi CBS 119687 TaxID=1392245 RepID=A0A6A6AJE5_9PLEO|nr:putative amino acid transporter [Dothidotthia symphoricarpi CBS 119687]KAF2131228.1 putative amino acid transporter [Dothidotthia symphoricarpi CBS 119687]